MKINANNLKVKNKILNISSLFIYFFELNVVENSVYVYVNRINWAVGNESNQDFGTHKKSQCV